MEKRRRKKESERGGASESNLKVVYSLEINSSAQTRMRVTTPCLFSLLAITLFSSCRKCIRLFLPHPTCHHCFIFPLISLICPLSTFISGHAISICHSHYAWISLTVTTVVALIQISLVLSIHIMPGTSPPCMSDLMGKGVYSDENRRVRWGIAKVCRRCQENSCYSKR